MCGYLSSTSETSSELDLIDGHAPIFGGQILKKSFTRSSYDTIGVVNGVKLDTRLNCKLLIEKCSPITQEWIVVGGVQGGGRKKYPISLPGDSGGLLVNEERNVVAMIIGGIWGATENHITGGILDNITVVTPAERLLTWIEAGLGLQMEFGV